MARLVNCTPLPVSVRRRGGGILALPACQRPVPGVGAAPAGADEAGGVAVRCLLTTAGPLPGEELDGDGVPTTYYVVPRDVARLAPLAGRTDLLCAPGGAWRVYDALEQFVADPDGDRVEPVPRGPCPACADRGFTVRPARGVEACPCGKGVALEATKG